MKSPRFLANFICKLPILLLILISTFTVEAQQKAFPSAYGGGAYASGGRGGNVYHVTRLDDIIVNSYPAEGTLRWALTQARPATVVFDVSGIIELQQGLTIDGNDLTIAGQTAPQGGITLTTSEPWMDIRFIQGENLIMRYLRMRPKAATDDAFEIYSARSEGAQNIILDHISVSYGGDEGFSIRGQETKNVTFQRGLIAESKTGSLFGDSDPANGGEFTYDNSFLTSLFVNVSHRTPNVASKFRVDIINNIVYDWKPRLTRATSGANLNHINNYYFKGNLNSTVYVFNGVYRYKLNVGDTSLNTLSIYASGNIIQDEFTDPNGDNRLLWAEFNGGAQSNYLPDNYFVNTQYPLIGEPIPIMTALEASINVPDDCGANKYLNADGTYGIYRDANDTDYINMVQTDTPEVYSNDGGAGGLHSYVDGQRYANFVASVSMVPLNTRPDSFYNESINSHIPEQWFLENVPSGQDHNDIAPSGYTWLEEYLNGVDSTIPDNVIVDTLEVSPNIANLNVLETIQLTATITTIDGDEIEANQIGDWSSSDPLIATVDSDGVVTGISTSTVPPYEASVTITYTYTDVNDVISTAISEITVFPEALLASAGIDQQICEGESTTLEASGGTSYVWNTGETTATIDVTPNVTTTYSVLVSDDYGQSEEVFVNVNVNIIPVADAGIDQTICEGESITLTVAGGTSYLWSTGETTESIIVNPVTETVYTVEAISNNCSSTDDIIVFVNEAPDIIVTEDLVIEEGSSTTLTASGGDNYLWSTGETTESIVVNPTETIIYSVTSIGSNGCSSNAEVNITVVPEVIADAGEDVTICSGESVTLNASGGVTYTWNTGDTAAQLIVMPTETTIYTVNVEDDYGFSDTDSVTIFVNDIPNITVDEDIWIMEGTSATLTANGGTSYSWNTGETTASISVSPLITTTYTVTGFSDNGCESSDEVLVTVVEELNANAGEDVSICIGDSVTLSASGGITYTWDSGDTGAFPTFSPTETTTYTVTVTDGFGNSDSDDITVFVDLPPTANAGEDITSCEGETVVLTATGGDTYLWSTGDTSATISVNPNTDTVYTVEVFTNSCSDSDSITVFVNPAPDIIVSDDITIIFGDSTTLLATGGDTYLWNTGETIDSILVNPTETTTYTVTGFSLINGCQASSSVTVTVIPELIADAGEDQQVCENDAYEIILTANEGDSYLWNTGATTQSITVSPLSTSTYTVTITSGSQQDTDDVTIYVDPNPNVVIANGNSVDIMDGDFVTLSASGANTYEWNNGATQPNIAVSPSVTSTYAVKGYIGNCFDEKQVTVNVIPEVDADAGEDVVICLGEIATLTAFGGDDYVWSTGETTQTIQVNPTETTEYTVTVFNALDFDEDTVIVEVDADCEEEVEVPGGEDQDFAFEIFPNPAADVVNVKLSGSDILTNVYLYDITGKLIHKARIVNDNQSNSSITQIDVSTLQPGMYYIKLFDVERGELSKKIIVN